MREKRKAESRKPKAESGERKRRRSAFRFRLSAFSLLEVILALAILAGALVVIGEYSRLGAENAHIAQDLTQAQFLCESKLAEIVAGVSPAESNGSEALQSDNDAQQQWICSVDVEPLEEQKLLAVTVTVTKDAPDDPHPVSCTLTRWMADPNATFSDTTTSTDNTSNPSPSNSPSS